MRQALTAVAAVAVLALSACGADGGTATPPAGNDGEIREVTVGMLPIMPTAALHAGIEQGFFEDHGLEVKIETGQGGAALLPAVMSGQLQFATSNPVSLLQAREQGIDVRVISHWTSSNADGEDANAVMTLADSGISDAGDLEGKTVSVNTLSGMGGLTIREAVRRAGGDPDKVKFVELAFPDAPAALDAGNVDAVWVPEPFVGSILAAGGKIVTHPGQESVPGHPTQLFFTSGQLAESDPQLVEDMTAAINETLEYVEENPDAVREAAKETTEIPPEVLDKVVMEEFGTDLRREQVTKIGELMLKDGLLKKEPDIDGLYGD